MGISLSQWLEYNKSVPLQALQQRYNEYYTTHLASKYDAEILEPHHEFNLVKIYLEFINNAPARAIEAVKVAKATKEKASLAKAIEERVKAGVAVIIEEESTAEAEAEVLAKAARHAVIDANTAKKEAAALAKAGSKPEQWFKGLLKLIFIAPTVVYLTGEAQNNTLDILYQAVNDLYSADKNRRKQEGVQFNETKKVWSSYAFHKLKDCSVEDWQLLSTLHKHNLLCLNYIERVCSPGNYPIHIQEILQFLTCNDGNKERFITAENVEFLLHYEGLELAMLKKIKQGFSEESLFLFLLLTKKPNKQVFNAIFELENGINSIRRQAQKQNNNVTLFGEKMDIAVPAPEITPTLIQQRSQEPIISLTYEQLKNLSPISELIAKLFMDKKCLKPYIYNFLLQNNLSENAARMLVYLFYIAELPDADRIKVFLHFSQHVSSSDNLLALINKVDGLNLHIRDMLQLLIVRPDIWDSIKKDRELIGIVRLFALCAMSPIYAEQSRKLGVQYNHEIARRAAIFYSKSLVSEVILFLHNRCQLTDENLKEKVKELVSFFNQGTPQSEIKDLQKFFLYDHFSMSEEGIEAKLHPRRNVSTVYVASLGHFALPRQDVVPGEELIQQQARPPK